MLKAFGKVLATDLKLATRNPDMILFGIVFPAAVMALLGCVSSPEAARLDFGGVVVFGICASGLMGLPLTLSDYRSKKILKRIRATPASPGLLLASQALVQCLYVALSAGTVYLIAKLGFGLALAGGALRFCLSFLFVQVSVFGLGLLVGSLSPSMKTTNVIASILYFPTIFLSGATVPYEILPAGLKAAVDLFPVTQGIKLMKGAVLGTPLEIFSAPTMALTLLIVIAYTVAIRFFRWE